MTPPKDQNITSYHNTLDRLRGALKECVQIPRMTSTKPQPPTPLREYLAPSEFRRANPDLSDAGLALAYMQHVRESRPVIIGVDLAKSE